MYIKKEPICMSVHAVHVIHKHWKFSVNMHDLYVHVIRLKKENYV